MKYRTKPVVINAIMWTGNWLDIPRWIQSLSDDGWAFEPGTRPPIEKNRDGSLLIRTPEGDMRGRIGDFIVCGLKGEFYPVKPDIFALKYEPILAS